MAWKPCLPESISAPSSSSSTAGQGATTSPLLPPLMDSVWICLSYYALGDYLQPFMDKHWYKLQGEWGKVLGSWILPFKVLQKGKGIACVQPHEEPAAQCAEQQCSTGMHEPLCWPSSAVQREVQIKYHINCEYNPPNPSGGLQSWDSHRNPCNSGRCSQQIGEKGSLAHATNSKGKIWIISDTLGHCSNLSLLHLT